METNPMGSQNEISYTQVTYTWESELGQPRQFLRSAFGDLRRAFELSYRLFRRDLSSQYRETLLGLVWLWVPALTVSATFVLAENASIIALEDTGIPYPAYILISTILWQVFSETASAPLRAIESAKPLLTRVRFPAEAMILARVWDAVLSFLVKVPLIVAVLIWYRMPVSWELLLFPLGVLSLFTMGLFIGLILVPIGGLYQDVSKSLPLALTFWMFLTPVVFAPQIGGLLGTVVQWNPLTPLVVTSRALLTSLPVSHPAPFAILFILSCMGLVGAWLLVRLALPIIVERSGN